MKKHTAITPTKATAAICDVKHGPVKPAGTGTLETSWFHSDACCLYLHCQCCWGWRGSSRNWQSCYSAQQTAGTPLSWPLRCCPAGCSSRPRIRSPGVRHKIISTQTHSLVSQYQLTSAFRRGFIHKHFEYVRTGSFRHCLIISWSSSQDCLSVHCSRFWAKGKEAARWAGNTG